MHQLSTPKSMQIALKQNTIRFMDSFSLKSNGKWRQMAVGEQQTENGPCFPFHKSVLQSIARLWLCKWARVDYVWIYLNLYSNYYFFSIYSLFSFTFAEIFGLIERNFPVDHLPLFGLFLPIRFYSNWNGNGNENGKGNRRVLWCSKSPR